MEKSCETCKNAKSCHKTIGVIWGFCLTDYEPQPTAPKSNDLPDFNSPECFFCEPD